MSRKSERDAALAAFVEKLASRYPDLAASVPRRATDPKDIGEFVIQNVDDGTRFDWLAELAMLTAPKRALPDFGVLMLSLAGIATGAALIHGIFVSPSFLGEIAQPGVARGLITFLFAFATVAVILTTVIATFWLKMDEVEKRGAFAKEILALMIGVMGTILGFYFGAANPDATMGPRNEGRVPQAPATQTAPSAPTGAEPAAKG